MDVLVLLSGAGFLDGSEIHESVLSLAALDRLGARVTLAAPHVPVSAVDHRTGKPDGATRSSLAEAARIARGKIVDVRQLDPARFDALVMPGGYGAAQVLCDFESAGAAARVQPDVARVVLGMLQAQKPVVAICIAPAVVAAVLRDAGLSARLTLGDDPGLIEVLARMGQQGVPCAVDQCVVDEARRIVTTPAYMYEARIADVARGIERAIEALGGWCAAGPKPRRASS
jgi:enhancing lycopene biosynthesis protein 2